MLLALIGCSIGVGVILSGFYLCHKGGFLNFIEGIVLIFLGISGFIPMFM